MARAVTRDNLGAWLIKCHPGVDPGLVRDLGAGGSWVTSRCVVRGYRSAMMKEGDPVVLWISGDGRLMARGVWGVGNVGSAVDDSVAGPVVALDISLFGSALTDAELRAAGVDDLEVQRMPAGSNPSWVSRQQWARIAPLVDVRTK